MGEAKSSETMVDRRTSDLDLDGICGGGDPLLPDAVLVEGLDLGQGLGVHALGRGLEGPLPAAVAEHAEGADAQGEEELGE